jgi:hypothetical protein
MLVISVALTGCETPAQSALLGAAVIGGAGYVIGRNDQRQRGHSYHHGYRDSRYGYRDSRYGYRDSRYGYRDSRYDHRRYYAPRPSWHRY